MRFRTLAVAIALFCLLPSGVAHAGDGVPPVATITPPSTLTGSLVVAFSENVQTVTTDNVLVQAEGSAAAIPASLQCRTAANAAVSCATGPARTAILTPAAPLTPGQIYGGLVNIPGAAPVTDLSGEPAAFTQRWFHGSITEEESSAAAVHRWRVPGDSSAFGGSYAIEHLGGAYASYSFTGTSIIWYTVRGPDQGKATVFIDGISKGTFDQYAASRRYHYGRTFGGLSVGRHAFTLRTEGTRRAAATNSYVIVDAFSVGGALNASPDLKFRWRTRSSSSALGGRYAVADLAGASVSFTFRGPGVDWYTALGPDQGLADIYLDGRYIKTVDNYRASTVFGAVYSIRNIDDIVHTMRVVAKGTKRSASRGKNVIVDRFVVRLVSTAAFRDLGAWVDLFDYGLDPHDATAAMRSHGVKTLYIQTARYNSSADIVYASKIDAWLLEAHTAGLKVVGWYLPAYSEYMNTDVRRTVAIAKYRSPQGQRFDALGVDIEYKGATSSLSEFNAGIVTHLDRVRAGAGSSFTIAAIVPSPIGMSLSPSSWTGFPWAAIGKRSHVVMPMAYWSYRTDCASNTAHCPYRYTIDNTSEAHRLTGLPVHVIGGVGNDVTTSEVSAFVNGARAAHAYGGSLYDYRTTASSYWPYLEKLNLL